MKSVIEKVPVGNPDTWTATSSVVQMSMQC